MMGWVIIKKIQGRLIIERKFVQGQSAENIRAKAKKVRTQQYGPQKSAREQLPKSPSDI